MVAAPWKTAPAAPPAGKRPFALPGDSVGAAAPKGTEQQPSLMERIAGSPAIKGILESQQAQDLASPGKAFQALDDMARIGADTASFGYADPAIGYFSGEDERAKTNAARERAGWAGTGMDVSTSVATLPNVAGKFVSGAKGVLPAMGRLLGYGTEGAVQSALNAHGHGERDPSALMLDAITGAGLGTLGATVGGQVGKWIDRRRARAAQTYKSAADVNTASEAKYKEAEDAGAHYPAAETDSLMKTFDDVLTAEDATAGLDDRALAWVKARRDKWGGQDMPVAKLEKLRRSIAKKLVGSDPKSSDALIGHKLREEIDNFLRDKVPVDPATGAPRPDVAASLKEGRDLAARGFRAEAVEKAGAAAGKRAGYFPGLGGRLEKPTQSEFGKVAAKAEKRGGGGYSDDEIGRMKEIAGGSFPRNLAAAAGNLSPTSSGLSALGHLFTGGLLTPVGGVAEGVSQLGRMATARQVEELGALVRDPSGKGLKTDPETVRRIRDLLARVMVTGGREAQQ